MNNRTTGTLCQKPAFIMIALFAYASILKKPGKPGF
jgi:hypothetical protein